MILILRFLVDHQELIKDFAYRAVLKEATTTNTSRCSENLGKETQKTPNKHNRRMKARNLFISGLKFPWPEKTRPSSRKESLEFLLHQILRKFNFCLKKRHSSKPSESPRAENHFQSGGGKRTFAVEAKWLGEESFWGRTIIVYGRVATLIRNREVRCVRCFFLLTFIKNN